MSFIIKALRAVTPLLLLLAGGANLCAAEPVITEFMASNKTTLTDTDGSHPDWIEIYNPDAAPVSLNGWYLSDTASNKKKWQFPAVTLPAGGYLVVFADDKDLRDPAAQLHTNFSLSNNGEYLGLTKPDGVTVVSQYAPTFPAQPADVSYGVDGASQAAGTPVGYLKSPTPGGPNTSIGLKEVAVFTPTSRTFVDQLSITLTGASSGQVIRYEIAGPSAAGIISPEPTASSAAYTKPFAVTSSVTVRAAVFSADGSSHGPVMTGQFIRLASADSSRTDTFSSGLPLVLIDAAGRESLADKATGKQPVYFQLFTPGANGLTTLTSTPTLATPIGVKVRGSTSALFPKKSYSVELHDDSGASISRSLLGLANNSDWALVSPWNYDRAYIRNAFVYALNNQVGRWAPRTKFVEVFLKANGDSLVAGNYAGLSVLTERIKVAPDLVNITSLGGSDITAPAVTGGYIFHFDPPDDDEFAWITGHGIPTGAGNSANTQIALASPKADKLKDAQRDYIVGYVQDFEDALFADRDASWATRRYLDYIDRDSWVDFHLLNVLTGNIDGLERSAYFTKDRNGKIKAGPAWDYDRALSSTDERDPGPTEWNGAEGTVDFWNSGWWQLLTRDPDFMQAWIDRWQSLRTNELSSAKLIALADSLAAQIPPEAAARDAARWSDNRSRYGDSFLGEVDHLKQYLVLRADWIDHQFVAAPVSVDDVDGTRITPPEGSYLAYTLDGSDPRGPGGQLTDNALLTTAPILLTGKAAVSVRIYNPNAATFPGTPWSSLRRIAAVNSGESRTIAAAMAPARLLNLSARGTLEPGGVLIAGVVVTGDAPKRFLARAAGPALADYDLPDALPDPVLRVLDAAGVEIARNDGWSGGSDAKNLPDISASVGAFPLKAGSHDAALILTLSPGAHTLHITSASAQRGVVLAELYALDDSPARLNLSTRGTVAGSDRLLIGGLNVDGDGPRHVLVRAVGPTLASYGVTDALADPVLTIFSGANAIAVNDDWEASDDPSTTASSASSVGAFALPAHSKDAALILNLPPGSYTFQVAGKDETSGTALIEVYELP